jgi:hypothetical protein
MNFQNLTLAILLAAYYTRSLDNLYRPDGYTARRRAALVAGARLIWYDGFRAGLEHRLTDRQAGVLPVPEAPRRPA